MSLPSAISSHDNPVLKILFNNDQSAFDQWKDTVLERAELTKNLSTPPSAQLLSLSNSGSDMSSLGKLIDNVERFGFGLYELKPTVPNTTESVKLLLDTLHLHDEDKGVIRETAGLSLLQDLSGTPKGRFPPYQPEPLNWHTDGYYNEPGNAVRCFTLHCVESAAQGGALNLMDDSLVVLALSREEPELCGLLAHPEAMTLPKNKDAEGHNRPDRTVPILAKETDGAITLRFTTRTQNIRWRCESTQKAAKRLAELVGQRSEWQHRILLGRGQGIISRNILHSRERFTDLAGNPKRQMLRGRFNCLPRLEKIPCTTGADTNNVIR